jgi:hypothetical protein
VVSVTDLSDIASLLETAKSLSTKLLGERQDSLCVDCLTNTGQYIATLTVDNAFSRMYKTKSTRLKLSKNEVYRVRVFPIKPLLSVIPEAVLDLPDSFEVDLSKAVDFEVIRLEVTYKLQADCLEGMVRARSSPEPLQDKTKFNLSAQLIDPTSLTKGFKEVDIRDFPVSAFVYVQENLDTAYPVMTEVRKLAELDRKVLSDRDPHAFKNIARLQRERHAQWNKVKREAPERIMKEVMSLLGPRHFVNYLSAQEPFRLHNCQWTGADTLLNYLGFSLPRGISAVTRTDLSYDRPYSKGQLIYESGKFQKDIEDAVNSQKTIRQVHAKMRAEKEQRR